MALAYLRAGDEPSADPAVLARCERVHEGRRGGVAGSAVRPWPRALAVLPQLARGRPLWVAGRWNREFARAVRELATEWRPDVLQAEFSAMAPYLEGVRSAAVRVVTVHEPGMGPARTRVEASTGAARLFWRLDARRWSRFERTALDATDVAVAFSEEDRAALVALGAATPVVRIPLATAIPAEPLNASGSDPARLLFVGNFVHPPNLDAAVHLTTVLLPRVREQVPDARLWLVGERAPPSLQPLGADGVDVTGWVPDLNPYLDAAALVVAPIRLGGGMRVKVAEALAAGKAVAGTPLAFAGIPVTTGVNATVAATDEAFVSGVVALLRDPARRAAMGRAAREMALAKLGPDRTAAAYEAVYASRAGRG